MLEFDHIALSVPNIREAVTFYQQSFPQASILYQDDSWAFVQVERPRIILIEYARLGVRASRFAKDCLRARRGTPIAHGLSSRLERPCAMGVPLRARRQSLANRLARTPKRAYSIKMIRGRSTCTNAHESS